jgi:hypothetical protein
MLAVAVGALADQVVAFRRRRGVVIERCVVASDVAGEEDARRAARVAKFGLDHRRAEQVTNVAVAAPDRAGGLKPFAQFNRPEQLERAGDVVLVEERQRRAVLGVAFAIGVVGVFLFQMCGIVKLQLAKLRGGLGAVNGAAETGLHKSRQVADVIDMRVRQNHAGDGGWIERQPLPVALAELFKSLEQAAVDQHASIARLE